jgi:hypothetical protein
MRVLALAAVLAVAAADTCNFNRTTAACPAVGQPCTEKVRRLFELVRGCAPAVAATRAHANAAASGALVGRRAAQVYAMWYCYLCAGRISAFPSSLLSFAPLASAVQIGCPGASILGCFTPLRPHLLRGCPLLSSLTIAMFILGGYADDFFASSSSHRAPRVSRLPPSTSTLHHSTTLRPTPFLPRAQILCSSGSYCKVDEVTTTGG